LEFLGLNIPRSRVVESSVLTSTLFNCPELTLGLTMEGKRRYLKD
jgi:hypothetical protein